jgi:hypothetical protein
MKKRTLITKKLYFGMDAVRLRDASGRVLSRLVGLSPERARVSTQNLHHDFGVNTVEGKALVDELVAEGLLQPHAEREGDYFLTERFVEVAAARVVEPLTRTKAKYLLVKACDLAARINAEWTHNPLEVEAVAPFGSYMSLDEELAELDLGIVAQPRETVRRVRWGRVATKTEGAIEIRAAFRELSSFVRVQMVRDRQLLPRPFAVVFQQR